MVGRNLTDEQRQQLAVCLLQNTERGKIIKGKRDEAVARWGVSIRTVSVIWARVKEQMRNDEVVNARSRRHGIAPANKKPIDLEALMALPLRDRGTCRSTATGMHVSKSTIHRAVMSKTIKSHTNAVHPCLTVECKTQRLEWCLSKVECNMHFKDMHNTIHIDEKWFYVTEATTRYLLAPNEPEPYRATQNKNYIPKLMFLCAVCRPFIDPLGNVLFDGKIGVFPYAEYKAAKNNSINRPRGTMVLTPTESINRECIRKKLIYELIPAIKAKWPPWASKIISIQQDNASSHILSNDPDFLAAANSDGFRINLVCQPPKSPDLNILDLGFFASIQSLQYRNPSTTLEGLWGAVVDAFENDDPNSLNDIFLSLQNVMIEIMKCMGGNGFKLPHMGKQRLRRLGILPHNLIVDSEVVRASLEHLVAIGRTEKVQDLLISMEMI